MAARLDLPLSLLRLVARAAEGESARVPATPGVGLSLRSAPLLLPGTPASPRPLRLVSAALPALGGWGRGRSAAGSGLESVDP